MTDDVFRPQIARLAETYGTHHYPKPRVELIWHAIKSLPDSFMEPTVNYFIGHMKTAPNVKEFLEKGDEFRTRENERKLTGSNGSFNLVLNHAAKYTKADTDFVKQCGKLLKDFQSKKITKPQFLQGCALLDQAARQYPSWEEP